MGPLPLGSRIDMKEWIEDCMKGIQHQYPDINWDARDKWIHYVAICNVYRGLQYPYPTYQELLELIAHHAEMGGE